MRTSADALANVPVYGGWLPIETAPKTGGGEAAELVILGFAPDEEGFSPSTCEGFWNPSLERWSSSLDPTWRSSPQPTHWMSLPAPPASGAFPSDESTMAAEGPARKVSEPNGQDNSSSEVSQ